jgi:hypothetical protein
MHWKQRLGKEIRELEKLDQTPGIRTKIARLKKKMISNHKGTNQQSKKKRCPKGHRYTKENTYFLKSGARRCKTCHRAASMRSYVKARKRLKPGKTAA